jgi:hypothetical protein
MSAPSTGRPLGRHREVRDGGARGQREDVDGLEGLGEGVDAGVRAAKRLAGLSGSRASCVHLVGSRERHLPRHRALTPEHDRAGLGAREGSPRWDDLHGSGARAYPRGGIPEQLLGRGRAGADVVIPVRQVRASQRALERPPELSQDC